MFRKAVLSDCGAIYNLICDMECRQLPYQKFFQIFQHQLQDSHYECLVNEQDGHVLAVLNLRFEDQLHHSARIAEIMEFAVDPNSRSKGIGRELLKHACETAKEHGCVQIEAACNRLRTETYRFYLREGMKDFHYKFSMSLTEDGPEENKIGR